MASMVQRKIDKLAENNPGLAKKMDAVGTSFYAEKYRFDLGVQFLVFLELGLLVLAASTGLRPYMVRLNPAFQSTWYIMLVLVPGFFLLVYLFGLYQDVFVRMQWRQEIQLGLRSYLWGTDNKNQLKMLEQQKMINEKFEAVKKKLEARLAAKRKGYKKA